MAREIYPSSYQCDCGQRFHFFENTVRELKRMSLKKAVKLSAGAGGDHTIVFYKGELLEIQCPETSRPDGKAG